MVTLTVTHPERVVLTVYEQTEGGEAKEVKSYKPSELAALATEGVAGYQFWKGTNAQLVAATEYVTVNDLLTDAGITFADLDTVTAAAADGFSSELTYADNETYRYYITEDGKTEVPAILALTWASGSGTLEEVAAAAKNTGASASATVSASSVRRSVRAGQAPRLQYRHDHRRARHEGRGAVGQPVPRCHGVRLVL